MTDNMDIVYVSLEAVVAVLCCLGNLLAIWAVWTSGSLRHPTFCFVASLAGADFLVGILGIPLTVLVDGKVITSFHGCLFLCCSLNMLNQASVLLLLAIAVDRHLRVKIPLRYKRSVTQKRSGAAVALCWLLAFVLGFPPMFGWYNRQTLSEMESSNATTLVCRFVNVIPLSFLAYFQFFGCILLPLLVMWGLYAHLFYTISKRLQKSQSTCSQSHAYYAKERKLAKSLVLVLVLFAMGWLPLCLINSVLAFGVHVPLVVIYVGVFLTQANSAINPIVYAFKVPKLRKAYLQAWRKCTPCCQREVAQSTESKESSSAVRNNRVAKSTEDSCDKLDYSET
ncbi:hypothetical protein COCON_G00174210 [Conger conger]|uniref:G-protein coupled receptors family 1 profile domain-containing protein n=1 Tax=Conger conger TaxID=82655 RepID=A0A9Q1D495_CONCO|nr:adenosine receptor A3-like [Conger conger]KAJ8258409.1 hypothetical protein COCON_G00174210 [Conger conger]